MSSTVTYVVKNDTLDLADQVEVGKLLVGDGKQFKVEWDAEAKVTPMGSLVYFAQYLQSGGLMSGLCKDTPLNYTSNNAPEVRDIMGTVVLSIINGQTRYAHINSLRGDCVGAEILGVSRVMSEDSVRRAFKRGTPEEWNIWLTKQERTVYEPLLTEDYIIDIDNTVKVLYGHQEGAEKGYNPQKPGRPSHNYHTYFIGALRIVLGVDVMPGKKSAGKYSMPGLWNLIDTLPSECLPRLIRGDIGYGNEKIMLEAEKRDQPYLFKLKQTSNVKKQIRGLECDSEAWRDVGESWQGTEHDLKLSGWSCTRRCIFLRRPVNTKNIVQAIQAKAGSEFDFVETLDSGPVFEYSVLVTNDKLSVEELAQLYRERADCENVFDEIKNQWGWAGFVTRDLQRCRIIARLIALVYNWWNVFTRLARPDIHMEAITSRPLLLHAIGRLVHTGRKKIIHLTSMHSLADKIRCTLNNINRFLNQLDQTAEQLSVEVRWAMILSVAFVKWLRGKALHPVSDGNQLLLQLLA